MVEGGCGRRSGGRRELEAAMWEGKVGEHLDHLNPQHNLPSRPTELLSRMNWVETFAWFPLVYGGEPGLGPRYM